MKKAWPSAIGLLAMLLLLTAGCDTPPPMPRLGPRYKPSNVYLRSPVLDPSIRRVAVLPITPVSASESLMRGVESFQPLLQAELQKGKRFEVVIVSPAILSRLTGQTRWSAEEKLPKDFFTKLHDETGCDAVFFAQLTRYQPYQPVSVGWKLNLINTGGVSQWAADELFDAGNGSVADAARDYAGENVKSEGPLADPDAILSSPSRFGQYTLHALLVTLPSR